MEQKVTTQEFAIVVAAKNHNPTILNPDFLRYSSIVPTDWELARPPVYTNQVSQIIYQNGVSLIAQPDRVMFVEALGEKEDSDVQVAAIAQKYFEVLSQAEYQALGMNIRGYVKCDGDAEAAYNYLTNQLMASGPWQEFGEAPVRAAVNLVYTLEQCRFYLSINEASIQFPEQEPTPVVLFAGNFNYEMAEGAVNRIQYLSESLSQWQSNLKVYKKLINEKFLANAFGSAADAPSLVVMSA